MIPRKDLDCSDRIMNASEHLNATVLPFATVRISTRTL